MGKILNMLKSFKNTASVVLGTVGAVAAGVSFIPGLPVWLNVGLKVVGIAAPVAGLIVGIVKHFKDKKKVQSPQNPVETAIICSSSKGREFTEENIRDLNASIEKDRQALEIVDNFNEYNEAVEDAAEMIVNPSKSDIREADEAIAAEEDRNAVEKKANLKKEKSKKNGRSWPEDRSWSEDYENPNAVEVEDLVSICDQMNAKYGDNIGALLQCLAA